MKEWLIEQIKGTIALLVISIALGAADWLYCWLFNLM